LARAEIVSGRVGGFETGFVGVGLDERSVDRGERQGCDSQAFNERRDCEQLLEGLWADGLVGLDDVLEGPVFFSC
jgi:hypothetical protein